MLDCGDANEAMVRDFMARRIPERPVRALSIMLACFGILGLLGNSLVLYVYARKRNKLSSTVFIIALAGIDLVTSAVGMPYTIVAEMLDYKISTDFSCKFYYFIITCTVPFSVFIMVAIAIDRYICICRPHSHVLDATRARNAVFVLLLVAMVLGVITAMFYGVYIDVATLRQFKAQSGPGAMMKNNFGNISDTLTFLELNACPSCVNHSSDDQFSERFLGALMGLYKTACDRQNIFNQSYIYTGYCLSNQILFSDNFRRTYQTIYSSSFLFCFFVVFVLYILIYKSVLMRRARRFAATSKTKVNLTVTQEISLTENQSMLNDSPDKSIALAEMNNGTHDKTRSNASFKAQPTQKQHLLERQTRHHVEAEELQHEASQRTGQLNNGCLRDKYFMANIRTAIMLFVVSVAFVIAYLPSWLMAFKVIQFNVIVFYAYFSNHIVNPIIYAFMNPAFRRSLKGLLCRNKPRAL